MVDYSWPFVLFCRRLSVGVEDPRRVHDVLFLRFLGKAIIRANGVAGTFPIPTTFLVRIGNFEACLAGIPWWNNLNRFYR